MNRRMPWVSVALIAAMAVAAPYKWVDKDGKVHYSDQPPPEGVKAEKVELKPLTEFEGEAASSVGVAQDAEPQAPADDTGYESMAISSPKDQETLRGSGIGLAISVALSPSLREGDSIEYLLDGKVVPQSVPYVDRGQHTVGARVIGPDGATKIAASTVTVFVFQNIAEPAQNAPPKPKPKKP